MNRVKQLLSMLIISVSIAVLQGCADQEAAKDAPFQEGTHYQVLNGLDKSNNKQVVLFFSAACPHCKKFDEYLKGWEQQVDADVIYERVPVTFGKKEWTLLSRIYAVGRQLGQQDRVVHALFKSVQEDRTWWSQDYEVIQWFGNLGFDLQTVDDLWRAQSTVELMKRYNRSEGRYAVRSIPRLIINGKYELITKSFEDEDAAERAEPSMESKKKISEAINYILTL